MNLTPRLGALAAASLVLASTGAVAAPAPSAARLSLTNAPAIAGPARVGASHGRENKQANGIGLVMLAGVAAGIAVVALAVGGVIGDNNNSASN